jgi:hypothetical protein
VNSAVINIGMQVSLLWVDLYKYMYIMEDYYLVIKENEIMSFAGKWFA